MGGGAARPLAGPRRPAAREPLAHPQAEALEQAGERLGLHLEAVARVELRERLGIGLRLDLPDTDWDDAAGALEDAYAFIADRV